MSTVNRVCRGLLSLIDAQTQGQNPSDFGAQIVPTLDVRNYLTASKGYEVITAAITSVPVLDASSFTGLVVPNNELWQVRQIQFTVTNNDAAVSFGSVGFQGELYVNGGTTQIAVASTANTRTIIPLASYSVTAHFPNDLIIPPGTLFQIGMETFTAFAGANPTYTARVLATRLSI